MLSIEKSGDQGEVSSPESPTIRFRVLGQLPAIQEVSIRYYNVLIW